METFEALAFEGKCVCVGGGTVHTECYPQEGLTPNHLNYNLVIFGLLQTQPPHVLVDDCIFDAQ